MLTAIADGGDDLAISNDSDNISNAATVGGDGSSGVLISDKVKAEMDSLLKEEIEKKKSIDGPTEKCLICFDDKSVDDFYRAPCGHNYCKDCLQMHYKLS